MKKHPAASNVLFPAWLLAALAAVWPWTLPASGVDVRFNLDQPETGLFPAPDASNPRPWLSLPFTGPIDLHSVTDETVFLVRLEDGVGDDTSDDAPSCRSNLIGLGRPLWDPATHTLHARVAEALDPAVRYVLIVTDGVRDLAGDPLEAKTFTRYRRQLTRRAALSNYDGQLRQALRSARREAGIDMADIAGAAVFAIQPDKGAAAAHHGDGHWRWRAARPVTYQLCENGPPQPDAGGTDGLALQKIVADGAVDQPTDLAFIPGTRGAFLVTGKTGTVYYFSNSCDPVNAIDIATLGVGVATAGEQGLLNIALHPGFRSNGYVFLYHTPADSSHNAITRLHLRLDEQGLMVLEQPVRVIDFHKNTNATNHNGGGLLFERDGSLLASVGDGGAGGSGNAQFDGNLLGKVIRIRPDLAADAPDYSYTVPTGNRFPATNPKCHGTADSALPCPEILANGLRNPFRMSREGGILYLGDVGAQYEEINSFDIRDATVNFGWPLYQGMAGVPGYRDPILYYNRDDATAQSFRDQDPTTPVGTPAGAASVMVGDVLGNHHHKGHGKGKLLFAEFYDGFMRSARVNRCGELIDRHQPPGKHLVHHAAITSMTEGEDGNVYLTTLVGPAMVYRLVKLEDD